MVNGRSENDFIGSTSEKARGKKKRKIAQIVEKIKTNFIGKAQKIPFFHFVRFERFSIVFYVVDAFVFFFLFCSFQPLVPKVSFILSHFAAAKAILFHSNELFFLVISEFDFDFGVCFVQNEHKETKKKIEENGNRLFARFKATKRNINRNK